MAFIVFGAMAQSPTDQKKSENKEDDQLKKLREASGSQAFFKALREQMDNDRKEFDKIFNKDLVDKFESMMQDMQNDFHNQWNQMLDDEDFGDFFRQIEMGPDQISYVWKKEKDKAYLHLKMVPMKDAPFEIKFEKGQIIIHGTLESTVEKESTSGKFLQKRISTVHKAIPLDPSIDSSSAHFKQGKDEIIISFTYKIKDEFKNPMPKTKKGMSPKTSPKKNELSPVNPAPGDVTI